MTNAPPKLAKIHLRPIARFGWLAIAIPVNKILIEQVLDDL